MTGRTEASTSGKKEPIHEFLENSSIHGLTDFVRAQGTAWKICWAIVLLGACGLLVFNIVKSSIDFYNAPMSTVVRIEYVDHFPQILFCPGGVAFSLQAKVRYNLTRDDVVFLNGYFWHRNTRFLEHELDDVTKLASERKISAILHKYNLTLPMFFKTLLQSTADVRRVSMLEVLGQTTQSIRTYLDSLPLQITGQGICFRIQPNISIRQGYLPNFVSLTFPSFKMNMYELGMPSLARAYDRGLLFVGNEVMSSHPVSLRGLMTKDNTANSIELIEARRILKKSRRFTCDDRPQHEAMNSIFRCYNDKRKRNCSFIMSFDGNAPTDRYCNELIHDVSSISKWDACLENNFFDVLPCNQTLYRSVITFVEYDDDYTNATTIVVSYAEVTRLVTAQYLSYTWQQYLSNIGGLTSLLCGASAISIIQAFFFAIRASTHKAHAPQDNERARMTIIDHGVGSGQQEDEADVGSGQQED